MPDHRIKLQVGLECPPYTCVWSEEQYTVLCILSGVSHALIKANVCFQYVPVLDVLACSEVMKYTGLTSAQAGYRPEICTFLFYAARTLISSQKF